MSKLLDAQTEAEKNLLSCLWIRKDHEADHLSEPFSVIGPGDFSDPDCRELAQGILDLHERDEPITTDSLYRQVEGRLSDRGRYALLLDDIMDRAPHDGHTMFYAGQVRDFATRLRLRTRLRNTIGALDDLSRDVSEIDLEFARYRHFLTSRGAGGVHMKTLGDVTPRKTHWLWQPYIPLGALTLVQGQPGIGKTFSLIDFASRVAMGWLWPDGSLMGEPGEVVFLSAEDDEEILAWRFDQMGCDRSKIHVMDKGVTEYNDGKARSRLLDLSRDVDRLEEFFESRPNVRMMIIDTAADFMGDANPNANNEVRAVYGPVARMAKRRNIAVILISHFNKNSSNTSAIYRGMGSLAFVALSRVAWGFFRDPDDPERVIFAGIKNNLAQMPPAMAFSIVDGKPAWEADPVDADADSLMQPRKPQAVKASDKAETWLRDQLRDGPKAAADLEAALPGGFCWKTVDRVSRNIHVTKQKVGINGEPKWLWSLSGVP